MHLVILGVDIAWNAIVETFTEGGGFVSKHLGNPLGSPGNPLLSTCRSDKRRACNPEVGSSSLPRLTRP